MTQESTEKFTSFLRALNIFAISTRQMHMALALLTTIHFLFFVEVEIDHFRYSMGSLFIRLGGEEEEEAGEEEIIHSFDELEEHVKSIPETFFGFNHTSLGNMTTYGDTMTFILGDPHHHGQHVKDTIEMKSTWKEDAGGTLRRFIEDKALMRSTPHFAFNMKFVDIDHTFFGDMCYMWDTYVEFTILGSTTKVEFEYEIYSCQIGQGNYHFNSLGKPHPESESESEGDSDMDEEAKREMKQNMKHEAHNDGVKLNGFDTPANHLISDHELLKKEEIKAKAQALRIHFKSTEDADSFLDSLPKSDVSDAHTIGRIGRYILLSLILYFSIMCFLRILKEGLRPNHELIDCFEGDEPEQVVYKPILKKEVKKGADDANGSNVVDGNVGSNDYDGPMINGVGVDIVVVEGKEIEVPGKTRYQKTVRSLKDFILGKNRAREGIIFGKRWSTLMCIIHFVQIAASIYAFLRISGYSVNMRLFLKLMGIQAAFAWVAIFYYIEANVGFKRFIWTAKVAYKQAVMYLLLVVPILAAFSFVGCSSFWSAHKFCDIRNTVMVLYAVACSDIIHDVFISLREVYSTYGMIYMYTYIMLFVYVILNIFLANISNTYEYITAYFVKKTREFELKKEQEEHAAEFGVDGTDHGEDGDDGEGKEHKEYKNGSGKDILHCANESLALTIRAMLLRHGDVEGGRRVRQMLMTELNIGLKH